MSLNKFMHPRNKYRRPPDFKALAIKYPEFRKHAKQDISGKVSLDFKNLETLRVLTTTLLKEDFNLDVEIPLSRLIPTLPLRLNYLLWIEDLLKSNNRTSDVTGIDIGCGASCVYTLLAAKHFCWRMLATEVDKESASIAANNVSRNSLTDMITVKNVEEGQMLDGVLETGTKYDFCMCNPPFFSSEEELDPQVVSRSPARPRPRNAHSGSTGELVAPGGETAFVTNIITDSVKLQDVVRIYSVMVGHKSSVKKLKSTMAELGISQIVTTEFYQGHTTRWGLAWTLVPQNSITLPQAKSGPSSLKQRTPFTHSWDLDLPTTVMKLHNLMTQLQITYTTLKSNQEICAMEITAKSNTWANSRKKRRQEKFKQALLKDGEEEAKTAGIYDDDNKKSVNDQIKTELVGCGKTSEENVSIKAGKSSICEGNISVDTNLLTDQSKIDGNSEVKGEYKRTFSDAEGSSSFNSSKKLKTEDICSESDFGTQKEPFLYGSLVVKKGDGGSVVDLCWIRGIGGRDAAHQVLQYFKNNLKTH